MVSTLKNRKSSPGKAWVPRSPWEDPSQTHQCQRWPHQWSSFQWSLSRPRWSPKYKKKYDKGTIWGDSTLLQNSFMWLSTLLTAGMTFFPSTTMGTLLLFLRATWSTARSSVKLIFSPGLQTIHSYIALPDKEQKKLFLKPEVSKIL